MYCSTNYYVLVWNENVTHEVNVPVIAAWSQFHASLVRQWSCLLVRAWVHSASPLSAPCSQVFSTLVEIHVQTLLKF